MRKRFFRIGSFAILLVAAGLAASCSGDDGDPGVVGTNGTEGVGFAEAVSKGGIILIVDGTRPDGVAFKDTVDFRFAGSNPNYSGLSRMNPASDVFNSVNLLRFQSMDDMLNSNNELGYIYSSSVGALQDESPNESMGIQLQVNGVTIKSPTENTYFMLNFGTSFSHYYDAETGEGPIEEGNLVDGAFASYKRVVGADGKFEYKVSGTVPAENNNTGRDLKITVIADAIVSEQIGGGI
jgi:hypothetical protein